MMFVAIAWFDLGIVGFLAVFVLTQGMLASAGIGILRRHMRGRLADGVGAVSGLVRDGLKLHLNSIGVLLFSGVDILMLNYFRGPAETGIFQLPMQLFIAILMVPQSALLVLNTKISSLDRTEFWNVHRRVILLIVGMMAVGSPLMWILAPWFIPLLGGEGFVESVGVFRILVIGMAGAAFNTLMGIQWIIRGYFYRASLITLGTGAVNVILNLFLIPRYGATGAAVATVAGLFLIPVTANLALAVIAERELKGKKL
jgi:O-antigen/teichoic acid export membrane protein